MAYDNLGDYQYALPELMRRIAVQPLAHQPGAGWRYGWSHAVLGRMIEIVGGLPLDEYLASAIFDPLDMVDSGFYVPPDKVGRLAAVYESTGGVLKRVDDEDAHEITEHIPLLSGGGGCASTALDYQRFIRMLSGQGELDGVRLLEPETVAQMTRIDWRRHFGRLRSAVTSPRVKAMGSASGSSSNHRRRAWPGPSGRTSGAGAGTPTSGSIRSGNSAPSTWCSSSLALP